MVGAKCSTTAGLCPKGRSQVKPHAVFSQNDCGTVGVLLCGAVPGRAICDDGGQAGAADVGLCARSAVGVGYGGTGVAAAGEVDQMAATLRRSGVAPKAFGPTKPSSMTILWVLLPPEW